MIRNRRNARLAATLLTPILLLGGCSGGSDEGAAPADDTAAPTTTSERRYLSLGTAPPGGAFFVVGGALASVVGAHVEGVKVTAEATKGTQENIRRLISGELDLALANAAISYHAVRGEGAWGEVHHIRAVMTLAPNVALFLTQRATGIERIADLKGKRVVVGPAGAGFEYFLRPILAAHGVTYEDFTALHGTQAATVAMLADGAADAAFLGGAVPTASITQAVTTQAIRFLPYEAEPVEQLLNDFPFFAHATIAGGTYRGQDDDYAGLNVGSMHLIAAASADEELIYQATRAIWENRTEVVQQHPAGKAIRETIVVRDTGTPFHPGAERFYREIGIWPAEE